MYLCYLFAGMFFFFKQKTAYEMRISDWSSDVCSSDLHLHQPLPAHTGKALIRQHAQNLALRCKRHVCDFVEIKRAAMPLLQQSGPHQSIAVLNTEQFFFDSLRRHPGGRYDSEGCIMPSAPARSEEHTSELQSLMRI